MASISEAVRRGMARGARLAMSPTPQTYRRIRTPQQDSVAQAWPLLAGGDAPAVHALVA